MRLSFFGRSTPTPTRSTRSVFRAAGSAHRLESLETRTLLSDTPLPALTDLESSTNAVIRMETTYGDVDIELFSSQVPITANNFINNYVLTGKLDLTFFHRDTDVGNSGIDILQGGGFYFDNTAGVSSVDSASPIVLESTATRGNVEGTISMARTSDPNSGTSQFFFNTVDNSAQLPAGSDGGYAVFGRVIQGWSVIQTISALSKHDINSDTPIAGSQFAGVFTDTPTNPSYSSGTVHEADLVYVINAEVIKQSGDHGFFDQRLVFPEGNRTDYSSESISLQNPNSVPVTYQIIARYEFGKREEVISSGTLNANTSLVIPLSVAGQTSPNLVRLDSPYALVVESSVATGVTGALPLAVSSTRTDFRATTSEEFFNVTGESDATLRTWDFARVERNALSMEFVTWLNLSDTTANITLTFYSSNASPVSVQYATKAFRRGGAEVFNLLGLTLPDGEYGLRVTSTQNLVVELSDWDLAAQGEDPSLVYTPGWALIGTPGGTSTSGAVADAQIFGTDHTSIISFVNPSNTVAVITLSIWRTSRLPNENPIQIVVTPILPSGGRTDYPLTQNTTGLPVGEHFTITYSSGATVVAGQYTSVNEFDRHLQTAITGDTGVSTSAITRTAGALGFTNASFDPSRTDDTDILNFALFNPFANSAITFHYTLDAYFSDGSSIAISTGDMTTNARLDIRLDQNTDLRAKALTATEFRTFSLVLRGTGTNGSTVHDVAGFAQLTRLDAVLGASMTSQGSLLGVAVAQDSSIFLP